MLTLNVALVTVHLGIGYNEYPLCTRFLTVEQFSTFITMTFCGFYLLVSFSAIPEQTTGRPEGKMPPRILINPINPAGEHIMANDKEEAGP